MFDEKTGLFDLTNFNEMADDDLLKLNIEFTENGDVSIPVPGGLKETPDKKPYDAASITIPSGKEITRETWNKMLSGFQNSFKEASEMIEAVKNGNIQIVEKTDEEFENEYVESAVAETIMKCYEDGPLFEKVDRSDKKNVKKIVRTIREKVDEYCTNNKIHFYKPNVLLRILGGLALIPTGIGAGPGIISAAAGINQIWKTRLWQVLGIVHIEEGNVTTLTKKLTEEFKEDLGDYKVLFFGAPSTMLDVFKKKFGWKNQKNTYFLLVDKKMPDEIKKAVNEINEGIKKSAEDKKEEKK